MNRRTFIKGSLALTAGLFIDNNCFGGMAMAADNQKWWRRTVVYQIYPKSFQDTSGNGIGDLRGIINRLDYLASLNVGAIWLTPIYPSPMVDNGYDISDYTSLDPTYGTMNDFDELIEEAHLRGIRVVMDLVYNHSSDRHQWFVESKSSRENPKADWYIWRDAVDGKPPTNWRSIFGGSAWQWCEERQQYYLHTFAKEQPDLNWENPHVRRALFDATRFWLDKGVGGFRIDAITYIKKPTAFIDGEPDGADGMINVHTMTANTKGILDFLREFKRECFVGRDIFTVGEANGVAAGELVDWVGDNGVFDMLFEFSHLNLNKDGEVWCRPRRWRLTELKTALSNSQKATATNGWCPVFFENHDQPRGVNHYFEKGVDPIKAAKALATVLMTMRGTPFIYEGQELGMTNVAWQSIKQYDYIQSHAQYEFALKEGLTADQALECVHEFSRDNARTPMQWSKDLNAGFSSAKPWLPVNENYLKVNAAVEDRESGSVLNWYRELSEFRRVHEELLSGTYEELLPKNEKIFAFERATGTKKLITLVNFSTEEAPLPKKFSTLKVLLGSELNPQPSELKPLEARICRA